MKLLFYLLSNSNLIKLDFFYILTLCDDIQPIMSFFDLVSDHRQVLILNFKKTVVDENHFVIFNFVDSQKDF